MKCLTGEAVAALLGGLVHAPKQCHDFETDLTVAALLRFTAPGAVDFGGSEAAAAPCEAIAPVKSSPGDEYGWWSLEPGSYRLRFNETVRLAQHQVGFVQPHERLVEAGASHPSFYFRGPRDVLETMLVAGSGGVRIKENARVSKLAVLEPSS